MQRQNFIRQLVQDMAVEEEYAEIPHLQDPEDFEMEHDGSIIPILSPSPEPSEELELTPSPGLRELLTPDPPDQSRLTPSPFMIYSPDMYLQLPESPEAIDTDIGEGTSAGIEFIAANSFEIKDGGPKAAEIRDLVDYLPINLNKGTPGPSKTKFPKSNRNKLMYNIHKKQKKHTIAEKKLTITSKSMKTETSQYLPESVDLPNYNENSNLKLLADTCDKNVIQIYMSDKNVASSRTEEASSYLEKTESRKSLALGPQRAIRSVSPEFGVGATDHIEQRSYNKKKLYETKKKAQSTRLNDKHEETDSSEISEDTPEPIHPPKRRKPTRMRLLPTKITQKTRKTLLREKVATSELDESELDLIVRELKNYKNKAVTPEPTNRAELSRSPELSKGTPEPIYPPQTKRSPRILLTSEINRSARKLLPTKKRQEKKKKLLFSPNSPIDKCYGSSDLNSTSVPSTSARVQARPRAQARQPLSSGSRAVIPRTVPRTRVLVTPERFKSLRFPTKRVHTPDRKSRKGKSKKYLRNSPKKRKWVESVRRHQELPRTDSSPSETTSSDNEGRTDSGNIGDCSDLNDDDDDDNGDYHNNGGGGAKKGDSGGKRGMGGSNSIVGERSGMGKPGNNRIEQSGDCSGKGGRYCDKCASCGCHILGGGSRSDDLGGNDANCSANSTDVTVQAREEQKPTGYAQYCIYL